MASSSAMLPFESVTIGRRAFSRVNPSTVSGHGSSRCQARFQSASSASSRPAGSISRSRSAASSISRWSTSSTSKARPDLRIPIIAAIYCPRHASAKAAASTSLRPIAARKPADSRVTLVRQSTTVPNTSKASALGRAGADMPQRGSSEAPISASSTLRAHWRPSRIAQTTRLCPRRISPQANTPGSEVA